jgi:radical SAM protein with 4Fe4S-binding SPASM domain
MLIEKLVIEIQELGVMYVKIGGGDPFLHPDFETIINLLRSAGCFLTISTNSALIKPQIVDLLAKAKVRTSVSIEGMEVVNDRLRGSGHFQKALNVLETLKKGGVNVLLRTTLLRQNLDDIPKLVNLARSREVKIKFSYCRPAGRAVYNQTMLSPQDSSRYLKVLKYLNSPEVLPHILMDEGMMFVQPVEILQKLLRGRMCGAANRSMHIDANGKVSPCIFFGPTFSFGEIYKDGTIRDFWQGKVGNKFQTVRAIRQPRECDSCSRLCKNECPASRFYFWGNYDQQDLNCLYEVTRKSDSLTV